MLLLAAAEQTGLVERLQAAVAPGVDSPTRLKESQPRVRRQMMLTLLFMNLFGVRRTWDLRSYSGDGLGLVSGRKRAYGYIHTERFLSQLAASGGAERLTDGLAEWTSGLWEVGNRPEGDALYVDGHRKAVYSDSLLGAAAACFAGAQHNWSNPRVAQRLPLVFKNADDELKARDAQEIRRVK